MWIDNTASTTGLAAASAAACRARAVTGPSPRRPRSLPHTHQASRPCCTRPPLGTCRCELARRASQRPAGQTREWAGGVRGLPRPDGGPAAVLCSQPHLRSAHVRGDVVANHDAGLRRLQGQSIVGQCRQSSASLPPTGAGCRGQRLGTPGSSTATPWLPGSLGHRRTTLGLRLQRAAQPPQAHQSQVVERQPVEGALRLAHHLRHARLIQCHLQRADKGTGPQ